MKLDDVELQQTTGFVIAQGSLKIGSKTSAAVDGSAHSHLLLASQPNVTTVWPVTQVKRNEYGFCETTLGEVGLTFRSLSLDDIGKLSVPEEGRRSLIRGGTIVGELYQRAKLGNGWVEKPGSSIQHYELAAEYGPEGLHVEISGQIGIAEGEPGRPFSIDTTIPWVTLSVKGSPFSGAYWKFGHPQGLPSKLDSPDRPRDSRKLCDLLLSEGLTHPYLKGRISFTPEPSWPSSSESAHDFVSIHFDYDQIWFNDARRLEVLDTGFARSDGVNRSLTVAMFDRGKLEDVLRQRDAISIRLEGNAIGSIRYRTPYAEEPFDPLGWIHQTIKTMSLHMALGKDGLEISADGELDGFDPLEFAAHQEKRDSKLKPLSTYSVRATMPWALLVARGFSFARREPNF